jgi:3'-phosphoadenosine 5'-phosphosulfate sulfotransferase (PAPS reductase)/FAD synthetase
MEIINLPIRQLIAYVKNPRKNDAAVGVVANSIKEYGFRIPILVDENYEIIAGHTRLKAAQQLGLETVPVIRVSDLTPEQVKAFRIADNKTAEYSTWDKDLLLGELSDLKKVNFDLSLTGFQDNELDKLVKSQGLAGSSPLRKSIQFKTEVADALSVDKEAVDLFSSRDTICCTFSGGKDSSAALLWAAKNFPKKQIIAIFSDTGYEFPGMSLHVWKVCKFLGVGLKIVKPQHDMILDIIENGWFSTIHLPCRFKYIYGPVQDYIKATYPPETVVIIDGSRGDQAMKGSKKTKTSGSADPKMKEYSYYHPCYDIDRTTQDKLLEESGVPQWEGYAKGFQRTSCWLCPGVNSKQAYAISQVYPWAAEKVREIEKITGKKWKWLVDKSIDDVLKSRGASAAWEQKEKELADTADLSTEV